MATRTRATSTASRDSNSNGRSLKARSTPFVALALVPLAALGCALALHYSVADSVVALGLTAVVISLVTAGIALLAHAIGRTRRRDMVLIWHVVVTVVLTGIGLAVTVVVGLERWWTTTFVIGGELLAASWALHRIDAFRKDPNSQAEQQEDSLTRKLGLEGTGFGRPEHHRDATGEITRTEVAVRHAPGQTVDVIQGAVPAIESLAGAPRGRSRAIPGEGAGTSRLVIIRKDVLRGLVEYPGPSSPGGSITDPLVTAVAEDQQPTAVYIAGGHPDAPNPASSGWMGMTRTGKTMNAQVRVQEIMSRRDVLVMWFDTVKGAQTVRPLRRGLDIIVASDDPKAFKAGMRAAQDLVKWRASELGKHGYRSWTPDAAVDPRLRMPFLVLHFEEADALCDIADEEMVWLASKGLSAGVSLGISLQRADNTSMPTGLRFNIGNWSCFGCGDSYSAGFALSDSTIDAGAHPEHWKQSKPGYHFTEGIGIPDDRWPITLKSMFSTDADMEAHAEEWGPQMMPLDQGSIDALGAWYATAKAETRRLVTEWDAGPGAAAVVHDGTSSTAGDEEDVVMLPASRPAAQDDDDDVAAELRKVRQEMEEMAAVTERDADEDGDPGEIDISKPVPGAPDSDLSWSDKGAAPTKEDALAAFERALREVAADPALQDPDREDTAVFGVATLIDRYKFRSRPWFSDHLAQVADGTLKFDGLLVERVLDGDDAKPGTYRVARLAEPAELAHSA